MAWSAGDLRLKVLEGSEAGETLKLLWPSIRLGRALEKTELEGWLFFRDPTVSRLHAELIWRYETHGFQLIHLSEKNPTLVNGQEVATKDLQIGDRIQIGAVVLELVRNQPTWLRETERKPVEKQ